MKKTYEEPTICVVTIGYAVTLLAGSYQRAKIVDDEEEEWPVEPGTNKPYSPW